MDINLRLNKMKSICKKLLPIILILVFVVTLTACDFDKFWGYVTGDGIGDFDGKNDTSQVVYNQGNIIQSSNPLADTIERILPSVVDITCTAVYLPAVGQSALVAIKGSGVIVDQDQEYLYIVGSYQSMYFEPTVLDENEKAYTLNGVQAKVTFMDGKVADATFVALIPSADTGLVKVKKTDALNYPTATMPSSTSTLVGEEIITISNPLGILGGTVTTGIVSAERQMQLDEQVSMEVIQTDAEITVNSGGILFNKSGEFIGVVYAKAIGEGIEGLNFAIPTSSIIDAYHKKGFLTGLKVGG